MPGEQYYALAQAIKRPMRRWWLAVGSWWLGGLSVLVIALIFIVYLENHPGNAQSSNTAFLFQWHAVLIMQLISLTTLAAIICSHKVDWLVSQLCESTPMQSTGKTAAFSFRLGMINCWPFLVPIIFIAMVAHFQSGYANHEAMQLVWLGFASGVERATYCALLLLWIVSLIVLHTVPRWVSWLFYFSTIASTGLLILVWVVFPNHSLMFPVNHSITLMEEIPLVVSLFLSALGVAMLYRLVYLYCRGKAKQAAWLASLVCLHILLINLNIGFGVIPIDLAIQSSGYYLVGLRPYHFEYFTPNSELRILIAGHTLAYPRSAVYAVIPPVMGAFWFALHFYLLSWMIRKVKPRTPV